MHIVNKEYPAAFAHGEIIKIFPNIFFITGTNIIAHNNITIQKSNNMVIVKNGTELTLINTLRLNDAGLRALELLGNVKHIVRLGAFHDLNDAFYLDKYNAKLWAIAGMQHKNQRKADYEIPNIHALPFPEAEFLVFATTLHPEGILLINLEGGILVTCDSIKNWTKIDEYFSEDTGKQFLAAGLIAPCNIDKVWLDAMAAKKSDFANIAKLEFKHLLSAHGTPIINTAKEQLLAIIDTIPFSTEHKHLI